MRASVAGVVTSLLALGCTGVGDTDPGGPIHDTNVHVVDTDTTDTGDTAKVTGDPVTIHYVGTVVTVANTPFGFDQTLRNKAVDGTITWNLSAIDINPSDPERGDYPHTGGGAFTMNVDGHTITGSDTPETQVEDMSADTWRYIDGVSIWDDPTPWMSFDGSPDGSMGLLIAITDESGAAFSSDAQPTAFPFTDITNYPHTFAIQTSQGNGGGGFLVQLTELTQP